MASRVTSRWPAKPQPSARGARASSTPRARTTLTLPQGHRERDGPAAAKDHCAQLALVLEAGPEPDQSRQAVDGDVVDAREHVSWTQARVGEQAAIRDPAEGQADHV